MFDTFDIQIVVTPGIYRHFKGGLYEVIGMAKHSETCDNMVVYKHVGEEELWVRPADMFVESLPNGIQRFMREK